MSTLLKLTLVIGKEFINKLDHVFHLGLLSMPCSRALTTLIIGSSTLTPERDGRILSWVGLLRNIIFIKSMYFIGNSI